LLEAEVTGGLEHPGIVPVYGLGHYPDGRPFYAMRFIRSDNLKDAVDQFHQADRRPSRDSGERALALRQLLLRFIDDCNAVAYAHSRGVLHRDLKPGNVMLGPYGETLVVDWGLAKPIGRPEGVPASMEGTLRPSAGSGLTPTRLGSAIGTPAYMSPEQAAGRLDELGPASDVYSLGAVLYSPLTGRAPFTDAELEAVLRKVQAGDFSPPRQVSRMVPAALEAIYLKAMVKEPDQRYSSPKELAGDVEHWLADEPVTAWREPMAARARRWLRRHRTLVATAAAILILGLAGLAGFATVMSNKNQQLDQQRQRAEQRENLALEAVRKFRDAVQTNPELKNRSELAILRNALLKESLAFFRQLRDQLQVDRDTQPRTLERFADASIDLAATTATIGDVTDAIRNNIAEIEMSRGQWKLASERLERAVTRQQTALAALPGHPLYPLYLRGHLLNQSKAQRALGLPQQSLRSTRELAILARGNPSELYNAACALALRIPQIGANARQALAVEAVGTLRDAIGAGWKDTARALCDPDLASLRDRDDFRRALAPLIYQNILPHPFAP